MILAIGEHFHMNARLKRQILSQFSRNTSNSRRSVDVAQVNIREKVHVDVRAAFIPSSLFSRMRPVLPRICL